MNLQIRSSERKPCFYELALSGRLDSSTYAQLESQIKLLLTGPVQGMVLDLALLEYISSMGLRVIFKAMKDVKAKNGVFMITSMQPAVKKVFEIANAVPMDSVFTSTQEADTYFDAIQEKIRKGGSAS